MTGTGDATAAPRPWTAAVQELVLSAGFDQAPEHDGTGIGLADGAERWTVGSARAYRFGADRSVDQGRFVGRLRRLSGHAPFEVPKVVGEIDGWVIVQRPEGLPADKPELHADPDDLVVAIGAGMRAMHEVPLSAAGPDPAVSAGPHPVADQRALPDGPPPDGLSVADLCRHAIEDGRLDTARLPSPYNRYGPTELLAIFLDPRPNRTGPAVDRPVLCHGFPAAVRFVVDNGRFVGFDRIEAPIVADRHFDLAIVHQSVQHHFGPEAVFRLYDAYGQDPDMVLLDQYVLASHLLSRSPRTGPSEDGGSVEGRSGDEPAGAVPSPTRAAT